MSEEGVEVWPLSPVGGRPLGLGTLVALVSLAHPRPLAALRATSGALVLGRSVGNHLVAT